MANYQDNRVRCSKETAEQLITSDVSRYRWTIDFRKALGMDPDEKIEWDYSSQEIPLYTEMEDGRYDFGFQSRWFSSLKIIRAFISRYHDAEWWICQDDVDIYHYYWSDGEVIEDIHRITEEEDQYIDEMFNKYEGRKDCVDHFVILFTEKEDQSQYVNYHPDIHSGEYAAYLETVRKIAKEIVDKGSFTGLRGYDYQWEGAYRYYGLAVNLRANYLYKREEDLSAYKMNIMSLDVLNEIQRLRYPEHPVNDDGYTIP